jgi:N-acetylmuramoyl-L-alanine amidase CwlA
MCITFNIPPSRIYGHRDYRHTLCPGENLYRHIPAIRVKVSEILEEWRRS